MSQPGASPTSHTPRLLLLLGVGAIFLVMVALSGTKETTNTVTDSVQGDVGFADQQQKRSDNQATANKAPTTRRQEEEERAKEKPSPPPTTNPATADGNDSSRQQLAASDKEQFAALQDLYSKRWTKNTVSSPASSPSFLTDYRGSRCGALVNNFCLKRLNAFYVISEDASQKPQPDKKKEKKLQKQQQQQASGSFAFLSPSGGTRMCNEGTSKKRRLVPIFLKRGSREVGELFADKQNASEQDKARSPGFEPHPNDVVIVPLCWETYGYHLYYCVLSVYVFLQRSGLLQLLKGAASGTSASNVYVAMGRTLSEKPYFVGSNTSWYDAVPHQYLKTSNNNNKMTRDGKGFKGPVEEQKDLERSSSSSGSDDQRNLQFESGIVPSPYWGWWKAVVSDPSRVVPLHYFVPGMCFGLGVLGTMPGTLATAAETAAFRDEVIRQHKGLLQVPNKWYNNTNYYITKAMPGGKQGSSSSATSSSKSLSCYASTNRTAAKVNTGRTYNVTFIQRDKWYQILNLDELVATTKQFFGDDAGHASPASPANVRVAHLEKLSFVEQMQLALDADILIGVHGNGLTWSGFMFPGAVLLELWPETAYNTNYVQFAERGGLRYVALEAKSNQCPQRCPVKYNTAVFRDKMQRAKAMLDWGRKC